MAPALSLKDGKSSTDAALSFRAAGLEVTVTAFRARALRELGVALTRGD
jgi:hypothetical protein